MAIVAGVGAFFGLARGLQTGDAIPVIALTSVAANCASIAGGILVFGDPVGDDPLGRGGALPRIRRRDRGRRADAGAAPDGQRPA